MKLKLTLSLAMGFLMPVATLSANSLDQIFGGNGSFESGYTEGNLFKGTFENPNPTTSRAIPGWVATKATGSDGSGTVNWYADEALAYDGSHSAAISIGGPYSPKSGTLSTVNAWAETPVLLEVGQLYELTFFAAAQFATHVTLDVGLDARAVGASSSQRFLNQQYVLPYIAAPDWSGSTEPLVWQEYRLTFTAPAEVFDVSFSLSPIKDPALVTSPHWAANVAIDQVALTAMPVPEPSSAMLILAAGIALLGSGRRRKV